MPHINPNDFTPESLSYSVSGRPAFQRRGARFRTTSGLFAAVMGLAVLLGRRPAA